MTAGVINTSLSIFLIFIIEWKQGYEEFCPFKTCEQCLCAQMDEYDHHKISFVTWVRNLHNRHILLEFGLPVETL